MEDVTLFYRVKKLHIKIDEQRIVDLNDTTKCICPIHTRNVVKEELCAKENAELHHEEMKLGQSKNGLSSIHYTILSTLAYAPLFTLLNVDFTITN
jgi:hypothetical protein